jgi:hypothetical protein
MGGPGSGSWRRQTSKTTVEESVALSTRHLKLGSDSSGAWTWTSSKGVRVSVRYVIYWGIESPTLSLRHRWGEHLDLRTTLSREATSMNFGGERWWFICPLEMNGAPCENRVAKIYLPPAANHFGCRKCHKLTYQSCQEAHRFQRSLSAPDRLQKQLNKLKNETSAR